MYNAENAGKLLTKRAKMLLFAYALRLELP